MNLFDGTDLLETTSTEVRTGFSSRAKCCAPLTPGRFTTATRTGSRLHLSVLQPPRQGDWSFWRQPVLPLVISRGGAGPDLGRSALLEMFPLPTGREIMSPYNIDMGASTIPAGVTVTVVDDPLEMYGKALKIDMAPGLSVQRLILKLKGSPVAGYMPKALRKLEWRMKPDGLSSPASGGLRQNPANSVGFEGHGGLLLDAQERQ